MAKGRTVSVFSILRKPHYAIASRLDATSINNALPNSDDCIPRVSWGKFVQEGDRWRMAMTLEVHHTLVDGQQVGAYFSAVQDAVNKIAP